MIATKLYMNCARNLQNLLDLQVSANVVFKVLNPPCDPRADAGVFIDRGVRLFSCSSLDSLHDLCYLGQVSYEQLLLGFASIGIDRPEN